MDIKQHTTPNMLEKYSFWWSEARLVLAAVALLLGGIPVIFAIFPIPGLFGLVGMFLKLAWIISGVASGYMLYRFWTGGKKVFGGTKQKDVVAFWFSVVTGLNLGIAGLLNMNIGMNIASGRIIFFIAGILYLLVAWHCYQRWNASGKKMFEHPSVPVVPTPTTPMVPPAGN